MLPCGHTVCKSHEIERKEKNAQINCCECNESHEIPLKGFPIVRAMADLLKRKLQNLDFGEEHLKATNAFKELGEFMKKIRQIKQNPESKIHEIVWELKNKIDLRREQLKKRIDDETQKLIDELDELEQKSFMNNDKIEEIRHSTELTEMLDSFERECSNFRNELRSFERNVDNWINIQNSCLSKLECLNDEYETFKQKVFDDRLFELELKQTKR